MIEIDGAHGEGGGQLVRMAVALSALTATPVRVVRIRAGRPVPGLASQHVTALQAVAELCSGELKGVDVGSSTIEFRPGTIAAGRYAFDVGTAGDGPPGVPAPPPPARFPSRTRPTPLLVGKGGRLGPPIRLFPPLFLPPLARLGAVNLLDE